jgi:CRISPR-associated protein Cas1
MTAEQDGVQADGGRAADVPEFVPARMLNEHAYCPRLAYIEWVQADFADNADTVDGRFQHRNVDDERGRLPAADEPEEVRLHARSVMLSAPELGLIARIDLVESEGSKATPVDYKRGRAPDLPEGAWEPERVQVCAQALILEANGYERVEHAVLYFVQSKQRVEIAIDDALRARTLELLADLRATAARPEPPPPLVDSPKCPRCSLVGICLPDETNMLSGAGDADGLRRLIPSRDDALPLYVQQAGTRVGKSGAELVVETRDGEKRKVRLADTSQISLFGPVQFSTQALQAVFERGLVVSYLSTGGWFYGVARGMDHKHVELRRRQFAAASSPLASLAIARRLVGVKIKNCRTLVRRNHPTPPEHTLARLRELVEQVDEAPSLATLLGYEGTAARLYFEAFAGMVRPPGEAVLAERSDAPKGMTFDFDGRNRRPPRDPVNALLSLGYALLAKDFTLAAMAVGFDAYLGFYHQPRYGRPALALDLMEEFRPLVVDSVVLSLINTGAIRLRDFVRRGGAVALTQGGRATFIRAYERRMDEEVTHPVFGYRISYRRTIEVQVRLLARHLAGEIDNYPAFATR